MTYSGMRSELQLLTIMFAGVGLLVIAALVYAPFGDWCMFATMRMMHFCVEASHPAVPSDLVCPK